MTKPLNKWYWKKNLPSGSAFPAIWSASEFAKSEFAGVTARIRQLGFLMYDMIIVLIRASISEGWSPTGTFVIPGRSTSVISRTFGEKIFKRICLSERPLLSPASLAVSAYSQTAKILSNKLTEHWYFVIQRIPTLFNQTLMYTVNYFVSSENQLDPSVY